MHQDPDKYIQRLIEELQSPNAFERSQAAWGLAFQGMAAEKAVPALVKALEMPDERVQLAVFTALGKIGSEEAIPALTDSLQHQGSRLRSRAIAALRQIHSEEAAASLAQALEDNDEWVQIEAANALGQLGFKSAIPALQKVFPRTKGKVRIQVANALKQIDPQQKQGFLMQRAPHLAQEHIREVNKILKNPTIIDLRDAVWSWGMSLVPLEEEALPIMRLALEHKEVYVKDAAVHCLVGIGSAEALSIMIEYYSKEVTFQWEIKKGIQKMSTFASEETLAVWKKLLLHENKELQLIAAQALHNIGSKDIIKPLMQVLKNSNTPIIEQAKQTLVSLGTLALPELIECLSSGEQDKEQRAASAELIGYIDSPDQELVTTLLYALSDPEDLVQEKVAEALGKFGTNAIDAVPYLEELLEAVDLDLQLAAAKALWQITGENQAVLSTLHGLVSSGNQFTSPPAALLLWELTGDAQRTLPTLLEASTDQLLLGEQVQTIEAIGQMGPAAIPAIPTLLAILDDCFYDTERAIYRSLGQIGSDDAIPKLVEQFHVARSSMQKEVIETLGNIGSKPAREALLDILPLVKQDGLIQVIVRIMGNSGSEDVLPALQKELFGGSYRTREDTSLAIGKIGTETAMTLLQQKLAKSTSSLLRDVAKAIWIFGGEAEHEVFFRFIFEGNFDIRRDAAEFFGTMAEQGHKVEQLSHPLHRLLGDQVWVVKTNAAKSIRKLSQEIVEPSALLDALTFQHTTVQQEVVKTIGHFTFTETIPTLIKTLSDEHSSNRLNAAHALGKLKATEAIPTLKMLLQDPIPAVRKHVTFALIRLGQGICIPWSKQLQVERKSSLISLQEQSEEYCSILQSNRNSKENYLEALEGLYWYPQGLLQWLPELTPTELETLEYWTSHHLFALKKLLHKYHMQNSRTELQKAINAFIQLQEETQRRQVIQQGDFLRQMQADMEANLFDEV